MRMKWKRLFIISNRLPVVVEQNGENQLIRPGAGGLITALTPVMKKSRGLWAGWPGPGEEKAIGDLLEEFSQKQSFELAPVFLTQDEVEKYYHGFSNEAIWPLFHDLLGYCKFNLEDWKSYVEVNHKFAETISQHIHPKDFLWIHDYQLMLVGQHLKEMGIQRPLAFFLHIPFPSLDLFRRLPWKREVIRALMEYDLLGFQTLRDRRNFTQCVKALIPEIWVTIKRRLSFIQYGERTVKVAHFPISIDFKEFDEGARTEEAAEAAWYLHENLPGRQLLLGLDRLDYTKGIPERFLSFERALEKYPDLREEISLVQVLIPSRAGVPGYQKLKETLDGLVGRINAKFSQHGWIPIHYVFQNLDRAQLLGHYKACEIAFITPLRDGMNLVAKEYCAASVDNNGVLILSEFAGAADQLSKGALMANPYDIEGMADMIHRAYHMDADERRRRMRTLRAEIRRNDVYRWVGWFLTAFGEHDFPSSDSPPDDEDEHSEVMDLGLWMGEARRSEKVP